MKYPIKQPIQLKAFVKHLTNMNRTLDSTERIVQENVTLEQSWLRTVLVIPLIMV